MNIEVGRISGILFSIRNGCDLICYNVNLLVGSTTSSLDIKFLALLETEIYSLNENWHYFIFLYVFFTSFVSNGGLPYNNAYRMAPIDHISTS